jgi:glycosyltransferase involved in cell wall biosynthesis
MKLFFVVGSFKMGGTERTASRIGIELLRRGHDVKFILLNPVFDYKEPALLKNSIVLIETRKRFKILTILSALFRLIRIVKKEQPDFLISFSMGINLFIFFTFYHRIIFRIESNLFIYRKKLYRRYLQKITALAPNIRHVIVPSKGLYDELAKYFFSPRKLVLVSNPINIQTIRQQADEPMGEFSFLEHKGFIVSAGRLHESKGFDQLIKVFSKSKLKGTYKLVILGEGPQKLQLQKLIEHEGLGEDVYLLGYQENPYKFFSRARYFVLNSKHESFGNVLVETLACDVPVLSNDCDFGPRHIITQDYNGVLFDQKNEPAFISILEKAAFDNGYYAMLKKGATESKSRYDISAIVDFWLGSILNKKTESSRL